MPSFLWKLLAAIIAFCALLAIPATLQVRRSLPCIGRVTSVAESQSQQRDNEGTLNLVETSSHRLAYTNPKTGVAETGALDNIYKNTGESVALLYDPSDKSISLDDPFTLYHTPLWIFGTLFVFWIIVVIAVRSK